MNVGRGDFVCVVKNQGVFVYYYCLDQGVVGQGKNYRKKFFIVWNFKNIKLYYCRSRNIF